MEVSPRVYSEIVIGTNFRGVKQSVSLLPLLLDVPPFGRHLQSGDYTYTLKLFLNHSPHCQDYQPDFYYFSNSSDDKLPTLTLPLIILGNSWLLQLTQYPKVQNYRHPIYRPKVVWRIVLVILYWLCYLGSSADADCNFSKNHPYTYTLNLSGPNRAMQPRCAMRFKSRTPKSLAMRKSFSLAMRIPIRLIWDHRKMPEKKKLRKSCDVGLRCQKSACFLRSSDAKCLRFGLPLRFGLRCECPRCQSLLIVLKLRM